MNSFDQSGSRPSGDGIDRSDVLQALAQLALPRLGDYAIIDIIDADGDPTQVGLAHVDSELEGAMREYRTLYPVGASNSGSPAMIAMHSREPVVLVSLRRESLARMTDNVDQLRRLRRLNPSGIISVPLVRRGKLLGSMTFCLTSDDREYDRADVALAVAVADRVSTVLHSLALAEELKRQTEEQRLELEIAALLQRATEPDGMVRGALRKLVAFLGVERSRLAEIDTDQGFVTIRSALVATASGSEREDLVDEEQRVRLGELPSDIEAQRQGEPFVVADTMTDPRTASFHERLYARRGVRALVSVPLRSADHWVASLSVSSAEPREWSQREIALVRRVGDSLWPAYEALRGLAEAQAARREAERRASEGERIARALVLTNKELAASEALLAGVVGSAMDAILSVDEGGAITVFNAAAQRIFGVSEDGAVGEPLHRFLQARLETDTGVHSIHLSADDLTSSPTDHAVEVIGRRADGSEFPAEVTISRVAGDTPQLVTVVVRDVTERRALEAQLMQAQKMEAVGQLAGGVAHDFNNILMVIRSYADFLRDSLDTTDDRRVDVDEILSAAGRATALTRQLLAFSRKQVVQPRTLDLNTVVHDIEPMLRRLIGEEIELGVMLHPERVAVRADPGQLEQVIINLAVNARDAMAEGGVLGIETDVVSLTPEEIRRYALDPVTVSQRSRPGEHAVIRVTDTGGGITEEVLGHIFEPFFTTKGEGRGTGLGLATVHGIVAQASGHVRVRSSAADGTTFEVLFPRLRREDSGEHLPVGTSHRPHGKGTILLVEDEVTVRRSVKRMLERAGYTIHEARHGADALLVWSEHGGGIDLLLTDLRMPELGGRELIAALHSKEPGLPVIAMSGYPPEMGTDPMGALASTRPVQFLAKPFSSEALLGAVELALRSA